MSQAINRWLQWLRDIQERRGCPHRAESRDEHAVIRARQADIKARLEELRIQNEVAMSGKRNER
jgi:hypothetical protein